MFKVFYLLAIILIVLLVALLGSQNESLITVNYVLASASIKLSVLMAVCLFIGFLIGILLAIKLNLSLRIKNRKLEKQYKVLTQEGSTAPK